MTVKILEVKGRPAFAVLPYDEYLALRELAEDADDAAALARFAQRYARGEEETVPASVVDRLLAGETPLRVWREHRGMTAGQLAAAVQMTPAHISKIESGKGEPSVSLLKKLALVLRLDMESLVGSAASPPPPKTRGAMRRERTPSGSRAARQPKRR